MVKIVEKPGKRKRSDAQSDETSGIKRIKSKNKQNSKTSDTTESAKEVKSTAQNGESADNFTEETTPVEHSKASDTEGKPGKSITAKKGKAKKDNSNVLRESNPQVTEARAEKKKVKLERRQLEREVLVNGNKSAGKVLEEYREGFEIEVKQSDSSKRVERLLVKFSRLEESKLAGQDISHELKRCLAKADQTISDLHLGPQDPLVKIRSRLSDREGDDWRVSSIPSGRFLEHDPVFSVDERYLFLAKFEGVQVYETKTSLLARSLPVKNVKCLAISASNARQIFLGTRKGHVYLYDWTNGERLQKFPAGSAQAVHAICTTQLPETDEDILIALETRRKNANTGKHTIVIRRAPWDNSEEAYQVLHHSDQSLRHIKVLEGGKVIFAASESTMIIGKIDKLSAILEGSTTSLSTLRTKYRWMELKPNSSITCLDARSRIQAEPSGNLREHVNHDLAIGTAKGEILVYQNIVKQLDVLYMEGQEKPLKFRALKWHREAPAAVKWSKDGNYLISGGSETVMCLWQLETGNRTDLPHLTAGIKSLAVSPRGISYGVLLSDNSVIVLSTTELKPKTAIAGLQSTCVAPSYDRRVNGSNPTTRLYNATCLLNNPRSSKEILLAVPIDQEAPSNAESAPSAPFLQTFDLQAGQHISRQALTRNLVTDIKIDPEWNKLEVPNVTHLAISHDGKWLATVDEWLPPARSLSHLPYDNKEMKFEREKRRETYLKIWLWNDADSVWSLNTRFDSPHRAEGNECASRIFDLVSHPTKIGFATIGEDSIVRLWRPKMRADQSFWETSGLIPIDKNTAGVTDVTEFPVYSSPVIGRLAYSNDGSVLAATQQDDRITQHSTINMLDTRTLEVRSAETNLATGKVLALAFIGRYLIAVSDKLSIWDAVKNSLVYSRKFAKDIRTLALPFRLATTHLAVNTRTETFAIAGYAISEEDESSIQVFSPTSSTPVFEHHIKYGMVSALTTLIDSSGFLVLDSQARLQSIGPAESPIIHGQKALPERLAIDNTMSHDDAVAGSVRNTGDDLGEDKHVVRGDGLAKLFEVGSGGHGLPSVKEMFDSVAGLLARK